MTNIKFIKDDIKSLIPHREPMLLIDEAEIFEGKAIGKYRIKGNEFFLDGHFPGQPIVPGVILCEMMAQTCCVLLSKSAKLPLFTGLNNVKFKRKVTPGDLVVFECEITKEKSPFYFAKGKGFVDGSLCVCGEFSFALVE